MASSSPASRLAASRLDEVDALVMPEQIDREGDQERHEVDAERLVRVERGTRGLRVLGDQLQVGERRQRGDPEGDQERQPGDAADLAGDVAGDGVDAGAEDVADDEQQQQSSAR